MTTRARRRRPARMLFALVLTVGAASGLAACSSSDDAAPTATTAPKLADPSAKGEELIKEFLTALEQEDSKALAEILAPNFQIQRADGTGADKQEYLADPAQISTYKFGPEFVGIQQGDTLSLRWSLEIDEVVNGVPLSQGNAPRITGFHWNGERWQIVTYANFNLPEPT